MPCQSTQWLAAFCPHTTRTGYISVTLMLPYCNAGILHCTALGNMALCSTVAVDHHCHTPEPPVAAVLPSVLLLEPPEKPLGLEGVTQAQAWTHPSAAAAAAVVLECLVGRAAAAAELAGRCPAGTC
jgi:hypothetical protein